uniref:Uncharacterized protein n=1 Tax=Oryza glumipatula TaxID=40148 RepID=A0A0D9ZSY2_9ORYZ
MVKLEQTHDITAHSTTATKKKQNKKNREPRPSSATKKQNNPRSASHAPRRPRSSPSAASSTAEAPPPSRRRCDPRHPRPPTREEDVTPRHHRLLAAVAATTRLPSNRDNSQRGIYAHRLRRFLAVVLLRPLSHHHQEGDAAAFADSCCHIKRSLIAVRSGTPPRCGQPTLDWKRRRRFKLRLHRPAPTRKDLEAHSLQLSILHHPGRGTRI